MFRWSLYCRARRYWYVAAVLALLSPIAAAPAAAGGVPERCFAETGQCVRGRFLAAWDAWGGLAIHGYPLGELRSEFLEDGREYTVQYFERSRFEYHPENAAPHDVLLGLMGSEVLNTNGWYR